MKSSQPNMDTAFRRNILGRLHPQQIIFLSFISLIVLGTVLLLLPASTISGHISLLDALFTSTSAVCVTGLIVLDTAKDFSRFGQWIILILIQIGGLGIITVSTFFLQIMGRSISMRSHFSLQELYTPAVGRQFRHLAVVVLLATLAIEAIGAVILYFSFDNYFPSSTAMFHAIFHSVSAFCNAGFSTFSNSLQDYKFHLPINLTFAALIILGGFGFFVLRELPGKILALLKRQRPHLSLHSKLVISASIILIITGAVAIILIENNQTLQTAPWYIKWLPALFQSITARTAGFNTINIGNTTNATALFLIILMVIGASPGSTGGGIKTTSAGIYVAMLNSRIRRREEVELFQRTVPQEIVSKAFATISAYILFAILVTFLLQITEETYVPLDVARGKFLELMFEAFSALGTVGLSMGSTPLLSPLGKLIICITMIAGRLGPLVLALTLIGRQKKGIYNYPEENIMIG